MTHTKITVNRLGSGPVSVQLADQLRDEIVRGKIKTGMYLPSIRKLTASHKLGNMTVRRALGILESEGLIAAEQGVGHLVLARVHDPERNCPVAFLFPQAEVEGSEGIYYHRLKRELEECVRAKGWSVMGLVVNLKQIPEAFEQLKAARCWGLVLDFAHPEIFACVRKAGLPTITADEWGCTAGFDSVVQDDFSGGQMAAQHVLDNGHERIGWFGPIGLTRHSRERYGGALSTLHAAGKTFARCEEVHYGFRDLNEKAHRLMAGPDRPTAILTLWLTVAKAMCKAANEAGLTIGKDLDLVGWAPEELHEEGFANELGADAAAIPVVSWRLRTLAETAIQRLFERKQNPDRPVLKLTVPVCLQLPKDTQGGRK